MKINNLKQIALKFMKKILLTVAVFAASTPSQVGSYQPDCPEKLKNIKLRKLWNE